MIFRHYFFLFALLELNRFESKVAWLSVCTANQEWHRIGNVIASTVCDVQSPVAHAVQTNAVRRETIQFKFVRRLIESAGNCDEDPEGNEPGNTLRAASA